MGSSFALPQIKQIQSNHRPRQITIQEVAPQADWILKITAENGRSGLFDVQPYLEYEAFTELTDRTAFQKVSHGGYCIEWEFGADLSADTIAARWETVNQ
jgi:hypothetical protein